jgi:hypothetical protein
MNPRFMMELELKSARERLLRGEKLKRDQIRHLSALCFGWFKKLLLPLLTPEQRVQLARGELPGGQQLFLALVDLLLRHPDLARAMEILPDALEQLRQKGQRLHPIAERAETIQALLGDLRRQIVARLVELNQKVLLAAQRLEPDPTLGRDERDVIEAALQTAGRQKRKRKEAGQARQKRQDKALAALREQAARARLPGEIARLSRALLGQDRKAAPAARTTAAPPAEEAPARKRPRTAPAEDDLAVEGAPLSRCLDGPIDAFAACQAELGPLLSDLGGQPMTKEEREALERGDGLVQADLALLLAGYVRACPRLAQAAETSADEMEELCQLLFVLPTAERDSGLLAQGARDGTLVLGTLVLVCYEEARKWLMGRLRALPEAEQGDVRADIRNLDEALRKAQERQADQGEKARRERTAAEAEVAEAAAAAHYEDVMERLRAGEKPSLAELVAAERYAQRHGAAEHARPAEPKEEKGKATGRSRRR